MKVDVDIKVDLNMKITPLIHNDVFKALQTGAEVLLTEANQSVPYDEGILKASGKTSGDSVNLITAVSYDTPYAVRLHENPQFNFQGNGRGKWLELTINEQKQMITALIASEIRTRINMGGGI